MNLIALGASLALSLAAAPNENQHTGSTNTATTPEQNATAGTNDSPTTTKAPSATAGSPTANTGHEEKTEAAAGAPNDAQIAHIVVTANTIDIDAGKKAMSKTKNDKVKAFAKQMVDDHSNVNKQATELVKKLKVKPQDNATSKTMKKDAATFAKSLSSKKGADYDKAYIDHEVAYHQAVLDAIDNTLLPNAQNAELKDLITKVRPAIEAHLEHAKHVQSELGGSGT